MKVFYHPDCNASEASQDSTRKHQLIAERVQKLKGVEIECPPEVTLGHLKNFHAPKYLEAIKTGEEPLASSPDIAWDKHTCARALASVAAIKAAAKQALRDPVAGAICSGFHHACYDFGGGYCTFNGLLAAACAVQPHCQRVLILDLDFHYGNGTADILSKVNLPGITNMTIFGQRYGELDHSRQTDAYRYTSPEEYEHMFMSACATIKCHAWDMVIYQAGMDPCELSAGGMTGIKPNLLVERDWEVFNACKEADVPIAFCMAGGYTSNRLTRDSLADLHTETFKQALKIYG